MIRTFWKETGLDDKDAVSWIEEKRFWAKFRERIEIWR
jgi:hypothetical protein